MEYQAGSIKELIDFESKVWVSEESLLRFYEEMWNSGNILSPNELKQLLQGE